MFVLGPRAAAPSVQAGGRFAGGQAAPGFPVGFTPAGDGTQYPGRLQSPQPLVLEYCMSPALLGCCGKPQALQDASVPLWSLPLRTETDPVLLQVLCQAALARRWKKLCSDR